MRECAEDGTGWRIDGAGDWWPCGETTMQTRDEREARQRLAPDAGDETEV